MTVKKTLYLGIGIVGVALLGAAGYYMVRMWMLNNNISTQAEAATAMANPNMLIVAIYDPSVDVNSGDDTDTTLLYDNSGADLADAVQINGVLYMGDASKAIYLDSSGNTYDGNQDTITDTSGNVTTVDPSTVTYGTIDENGNFIPDTSS